MKYLFFATAFISLLFPAVTNAAHFTVQPGTGTHEVGTVFSVTIGVNPSGSSVYTAKLDAKISPELELVSFVMNDALLPLKVAGYDAFDIANGTVLKTGGYTGGLSSSGSFGTLTLRAKSVGVGTVVVRESSELLDSNNADTQTGVVSYSFVVTQPNPITPVTQEVSEVSAPPKAQESKSVVAKSQPKKNTVTEVATTSADIPAATSSQVASVGVFTGGFLWALWAFSVIASFVTGYYVGRRRSRRYAR